MVPKSPLSCCYVQLCEPASCTFDLILRPGLQSHTGQPHRSFEPLYIVGFLLWKPTSGRKGVMGKVRGIQCLLRDSDMAEMRRNITNCGRMASRAKRIQKGWRCPHLSTVLNPDVLSPLMVKRRSMEGQHTFDFTQHPSLTYSTRNAPYLTCIGTSCVLTFLYQIKQEHVFYSL